jgi:hypothetical protein
MNGIATDEKAKSMEIKLAIYSFVEVAGMFVNLLARGNNVEIAKILRTIEVARIKSYYVNYLSVSIIS